MQAAWKKQGVFLRKNRKGFDGSVSEYCTLRQTVRTERVPRKRVVTTLDKLDEDDLRVGWRETRTDRDKTRDRLVVSLFRDRNVGTGYSFETFVHKRRIRALRCGVLTSCVHAAHPFNPPQHLPKPNGSAESCEYLVSGPRTMLRQATITACPVWWIAP